MIPLDISIYLSVRCKAENIPSHIENTRKMAPMYHTACGDGNPVAGPIVVHIPSPVGRLFCPARQFPDNHTET